jgi:phosphoribosylformylglycinamidine synthase subunit PurL
LEKCIVGAEWSEHCSYKSTKKQIRLLPTSGKRVVVGPGFDAGVVDVGDNYVVSIHIESHNHPSAVEPYGGAATGVGGVIRDILSMGTRPIALLNSLRFGPIQPKNKTYSAKSKWLFKNVVHGISDYGNCIGVPTVGGEVEFDESFEDYCLVDVASIGIGKASKIITNSADVGDNIVLVGGLTGRDGINGASFASRNLEEEDRSAVQVPDPFLEKLILEATIEAVGKGCISAIKDLGGGGLSCGLSEMSDTLKKGLDVDLTKIKLKGKNMSAIEVMLSESQERMLYIVSDSKTKEIESILDKFGLDYSIIGKVMPHRNLVLRSDKMVVADMPAEIISHAPLIVRRIRRPGYIRRLRKIASPPIPDDLTSSLIFLLSDPTIANKEWVYQQFDHEVGLRTVTKPGNGDAAVLRLDNGKLLSVKLDGNSKHCYLDPYNGTLGCLSESRRNIISTGAEPIGVIDHLQFGNPEDPEVFWTFTQSVKAIIDFCTKMELPVLGGKVSLYNETLHGAIKPSPVIGAMGLIESGSNILDYTLLSDSDLFVIGYSSDEMGGSEYYEYNCNVSGGNVPKVDLDVDKINGEAVLKLINRDLVNCVHDCSKGGIAVALAEMGIKSDVGINVNIDLIPSSCTRIDNLLFSESNSRYIVATSDPAKLDRELKKIRGVVFAHIGESNNDKSFELVNRKNEKLIDTHIWRLSESYGKLRGLMSGSQTSTSI